MSLLTEVPVDKTKASCQRFEIRKKTYLNVTKSSSVTKNEHWHASARNPMLSPRQGTYAYDDTQLATGPPRRHSLVQLASKRIKKLNFLIRICESLDRCRRAGDSTRLHWYCATGDSLLFEFIVSSQTLKYY